ncbi:hypothetical protein [Nostoc sp. 'Peltigera membranacea cyanobiont' 213]|nr:hypothetical protein [Nostoc sp. 'Peltigera membranacea cyanobiont' 213]
MSVTMLRPATSAIAPKDENINLSKHGNRSLYQLLASNGMSYVCRYCNHLLCISLDPTERFQFINIAKWSSKEAWKSAFSKRISQNEIFEQQLPLCC